MYYVDGKTYEDIKDVPDLGSFVGEAALYGRREYYGLSKDTAKLPKYDDLASGSIAM